MTKSEMTERGMTKSASSEQIATSTPGRAREEYRMAMA
jgi:hypothetical protein